MNHAFQYQRLVLAYHGCDQKVADAVIQNGRTLTKSEKDYDWLGSGIYFWEHGPERALEWARSQDKVKKPAVLGAIIHLGQCFDLLDTRATQLLASSFEDFRSDFLKVGRPLPTNSPSPRVSNDKDQLLRRLDCSVLNWLMERLDDDELSPTFDSVRGLFQEDEAVFEGSAIRRKSHIQIAVRNPSCIIGYFKPS